MKLAVLRHARRPNGPQTNGMSLRLFAIICAFIISLALWNLAFLLIAGCARTQPPCADCYIGLQQLEQSR